MSEIGSDRIMFSTDWPFGARTPAVWFDKASTAKRMRRSAAIVVRLFKLGHGWIVMQGKIVLEEHCAA
jgi:hypothetical protein